MSKSERSIDTTSTAFGTDTTDAPAGFTRDPADYTPTEDFLTRFSHSHGPKSATQIAPEITGDVVSTCIREGELLAAADGCWRLEAAVEGHGWRLVVDVRDDVNRVVTALVPGVHQSGDHNPARRLGGESR